MRIIAPAPLYPPEFVADLPDANRHEHRPLLLLLKRGHVDPAAETERIERWYSELDGSAASKRRLAGDLRSLQPRNFWGALHELATSRVFVECGWHPIYEPDVRGLRPDFLVRPPSGPEFIAEVLTIFQPPDQERAEANLYRIASALDEIEHRIGVFIDRAWSPPRTPQLGPVVDRVRKWLDTCDGVRKRTLTLHRPIALRISSVVPPRDEAGPIVMGMVDAAGEINADQTMWAAITRKIKKYRAVKDLGIPFLLFIWEGHWLKVSDTSLNWALFGRRRYTIFRQGGRRIGGEWGRAPGGLFAFGRDGGDPRNTRISAVVYCARDVIEARVHARVQLFHHPYAAHPLPATLFEGVVSQCLPERATADEAVCRWDYPPGELPSILLR